MAMTKIRERLLNAMIFLGCLAIVILPTILFFVSRRRVSYLEILAYGAFVASLAKHEYGWAVVFAALFVLTVGITQGVREVESFKRCEEDLGADDHG